MTFPGISGENVTGATSGGFECSEDYYLMAGNSVVQDDDNLSRSTRNVFISAVNKSTNAVTTNWITSYTEGDGTTSTPHLVKVSDDRFIILWSRDDNVYYTECDGKHTIVKFDYLAETCSTDGHQEYWGCENCKKGFTDQTGVEELAEELYVLNGGHKYVSSSVSNGAAHLTCSVCGTEKDAAVFTWLTVSPYFSESDDELLVEISDKDLISYTVTYVSDEDQMGYFTMKKAGTAQITIRSKYNSNLSYNYKITITCSSHEWNTEYSSDANKHWIECENCGEVKESAAHSGGITTCTEAPICTVCGVEYSSAYGHDWDISYDETTHWSECSRCHEIKAAEEHYGGTATCTDAAVCEFCKETYGSELGHDWDSKWSADTVSHWYACSRCDAIQEGSVVTILYNPFTDIKEKDYFYNPVLWAVDKNITNGMTTTTFGPDLSCTRAQAVTFLWRSQGYPKVSASTVNPFTDVKSTDYFYEAVLWAAEVGVTTGLENNLFGSDNFCTRGQVVTFLHRMYV